MKISNLFKTKIDRNIYSPVKGFCTDIIKCSDSAFSSKTMGDGFLVVPESDMICAPCDGILKMIFPTNHAFGLVTADGKELIVHIGIDTVELKGKGFQRIGQIETNVRRNEPIIKIDRKLLVESGYDISVMTVIIGSENLVKKNLNQEVDVSDIIIER